MTMEYIPRKQLRDRLLAGWTLVPGMDYPRDEYAFLMAFPDPAIIPTDAEVDKIMRRFTRPIRLIVSNVQAAYQNRRKYRKRTKEERWEAHRAERASLGVTA